MLRGGVCRATHVFVGMPTNTCVATSAAEAALSFVDSSRIRASVHLVGRIAVFQMQSGQVVDVRDILFGPGALP